MSLFITSLNSGSNGNCYYVGNEDEAILVDVGISCRQIESRMRRLGLSITKVKAIFISHEHSDHITGVPMLAAKYQIPVYITAKTLQNCKYPQTGFPIYILPSNDSIWVGELCVKSFAKWHDAADPHSFLVSYQGINVGVFTDIGAPCERLISHFEQCHAAFLEANYDEVMLTQSRYPYFLKERIRGGKGHLSNQQALSLFQAYRPAFMSHLILSHLSKENNHPQVAWDLFHPHMNETELVVASRHQETPLYQIKSTKIEIEVTSSE